MQLEQACKRVKGGQAKSCLACSKAKQKCVGMIWEGGECREALPYMTMLVVVCTYSVARYTATLAIFSNSSLNIVTAMKKYNGLVFFHVDLLSTPPHFLHIFEYLFFLLLWLAGNSQQKISEEKGQ